MGGRKAQTGWLQATPKPPCEQDHSCTLTRLYGRSSQLRSSWSGRPNPVPWLVVSSLQPLPPPCVSAFSSQKDPVLGRRVQCEPILTSTKTRLPDKVACEVPSGCEFGRHASFPQRRTPAVPRTLAPELTGGGVGGGTAHVEPPCQAPPSPPRWLQEVHPGWGGVLHAQQV